MMVNMETRRLEFSLLRKSYITVRDFIEEESGCRIKSLNTRIEEDLSLSGDDNLELIEKFVSKFNLEFGEFDYSKHFMDEMELFSSEAAFYNIIKMIVWIPLKLIELLSFNKFRLTESFWARSRKTLDLSFREMLTWYIEGKFRLGNEMRYLLKSPH